MSISSIMGSATLALQAQQIAIQTDSNNIANASTAGYSREIVSLAPNLPNYTNAGALGTGVTVTDISRVRDTLLDTTYRNQNALASGYNTQYNALNSIQNVFGEPSDTGLSATMDQFFSAWGDLANNPTSDAAKSVVQQKGAAVASMLNQFSTNLDGISSAQLSQVSQQVGNINQYSSQIASINQQIVAAQSNGSTASNLLDARDQLLDQISSIAPVQVINNSNGSDTVYIGGATIVDGNASRQLSLQTSNGQLSIQAGSTTLRNASITGSLGAAIGIYNNDVPAAKQQLDSMAAALVSKVNSIHEQGWTAAGDALGNSNWNSSTPPTGSNVDFFDPTKTTAATISLSSQVASSASYIAAGDVQNGTGNNDIANDMAALANDTTTITKYGGVGTTSFSGFYNDLVTRVASSTSAAQSSSTVYQTLATQADTQRQSVSGVSTDDELIDLTKRQQAYAAAAKVVTVADEMSQTLIAMIT